MEDKVCAEFEDKAENQSEVAEMTEGTLVWRSWEVQKPQDQAGLRRQQAEWGYPQADWDIPKGVNSYLHPLSFPLISLHTEMQGARKKLKLKYPERNNMNIYYFLEEKKDKWEDTFMQKATFILALGHLPTEQSPLSTTRQLFSLDKPPSCNKFLLILSDVSPRTRFDNP